MVVFEKIFVKLKNITTFLTKLSLIWRKAQQFYTKPSLSWRMALNFSLSHPHSLWTLTLKASNSRTPSLLCPCSTTATVPSPFVFTVMALHSCVLTVIVTTPSPFVSTAIVLQSCALVVTTMTLLFAYSVSLTLNPFILFLLPLSLLLVPVNSFVSARFGFLELMLTVIFVERQKVWVSGIGVWEVSTKGVVFHICAPLVWLFAQALMMCWKLFEWYFVLSFAIFVESCSIMLQYFSIFCTSRDGLGFCCQSCSKQQQRQCVQQILLGSMALGTSFSWGWPYAFSPPSNLSGLFSLVTCWHAGNINGKLSFIRWMNLLHGIIIYWPVANCGTLFSGS